jgi:hypothetical protein
MSGNAHEFFSYVLITKGNDSMKKWQKRLLILGVSLGVLGIGAKFAFDYAADKAMKKLVSEVSSDPEVKKILEDKDIQNKLNQLKNDPNLKKDIETAAQQLPGKKQENSQSSTQAEGKKQSSADTSNKREASSGSIHFSNTSEAARYAMKRFSVSEINYYRGLAKDGLTPAEKKEIKAVVLSRFSKEEIRAFIEVAR